MMLKYFIVVSLQLILLQSVHTESCETLRGSSGVISFDTNTRQNYRRCWYIDVPEDSYVRLDLVENNLSDPYCDYMYIEVTDQNSGESEKICQQNYMSRNWTKTALNSVNITIIIRNSWRNYVSFRMQYYTESIACLRGDHFRCSEKQCVYPNQVCDGKEDCENGSDEEKCGLVKDIRGISVSRRRAIDWLRKHQADYGWGRNTHRAITALFLTGEAGFRGSELEEEIMVKELEVKVAAALLGNSTEPMSVNELSMYVNAMLVTCHDPRNLFGKDLVKILASRTLSSASPSPGAYLSLCSANYPLSAADVRKLLDLLSKDTEYPFVFEIQAMTIMALSCIQQKTGMLYNLQNGTDIYNETIENFMAHQNSDGSFGNKHTTAIVTQALISSGQTENQRWSFEDAMKFLMSNSTSPDFLSVYLTLPLFKGKTLLDVGNVDCSNYKRRLGEDDDVSDIMDKIGGNTQVQYSLYIGDRKNIMHTIYLKVQENSTVFDVMKIAALADHKYKFSYHKLHNQVYVYEIAGITNDMEAGNFWLLYKANPAKKSTLTHYTTNPEEMILENRDHLIYWYKTADF